MLALCDVSMKTLACASHSCFAQVSEVMLAMQSIIASCHGLSSCAAELACPQQSAEAWASKGCRASVGNSPTRSGERDARCGRTFCMVRMHTIRTHQLPEVPNSSLRKVGPAKPLESLTFELPLPQTGHATSMMYGRLTCARVCTMRIFLKKRVLEELFPKPADAAFGDIKRSSSCEHICLCPKTSFRRPRTWQCQSLLGWGTIPEEVRLPRVSL